MEARCTKMLEDAKLKELESVAAAWLTIVERNDAISMLFRLTPRGAGGR